MKNLFSVLLAMLLSCPIFTALAEGASPTDIVQAQLDAYNARDLEAFAATYTDDIEISNFPDAGVSRGIDLLKQRYQKMFDNTPNLHAKITGRIVQGEYVIDHEFVTVNDRHIQAVAIYHVDMEKQKIDKVWFIR